MGRHWTIDGVDVPLTPQEEIDLDAEWATYNAGIPMRDWKASISALDFDMPRSLEDVLEGMPDKSGVAKTTLDRLQAKKDLRGTKP